MTASVRREQGRGLMGKLGRSVRHLAQTQEDLAAEEVYAEAHKSAECCLEDLCDRQVASVSGVVKSVTLAPKSGMQTLNVELFDGTGYLNLVWLGRRRIVGIDPGIFLRAKGRVVRKGEDNVMFNPEYELLTVQGG